MNYINSKFEQWTDYLFKEVEIFPLSIFRILLGFFLIFSTYYLYLDFDIWYSEEGFVNNKTIHLYDYSYYRVYTFLNKDLMKLIFLVNILSSITFTVGHKTKSSNIVMLISLVLIHLRNPLILQA